MFRIFANNCSLEANKWFFNGLIKRFKKHFKKCLMMVKRVIAHII